MHDAGWPVRKSEHIRQRWFGLALSSSVLMALSAPGHDLSVLAWVALIPLLLALAERTPVSSFWLAFFSGMLANAGVVYWVAIPAEVTIPDFLLIAGYLGIWWGLFGATLALVRRRQMLPLAVAAPAIWVTFEYVRSHFFFLELPWILLGHTQYRWTDMIQLASITGVYGISFLIVLVNAAITDVLQDIGQGKRSIMAAAALVGCTWLFGYLALSAPPADRTIPVTIVPGNVAQTDRWDPGQQEANFNRYVSATREAIQDATTVLVVWPETSVPGQLRRDLTTVQTVQDLARHANASILLGSADREKFGQGRAEQVDPYNSAFLVSPVDAPPQTYYKMKLLPFGEYLPLPSAFFWPARYRAQSSHYAPGSEYSIFHMVGPWSSVSFAVTICWESIFADHIRPFVQRGAQFVVVMSNEAWFSGSAAIDQLLAMNVFRAAEYRRAIVRSVNGGISGFIDPYGRLLALASPKQDGPGYLTHTIPITDVGTFYGANGDLFAQCMAALTLFACSIRVRRGKAVEHAHIPPMPIPGSCSHH